MPGERDIMIKELPVSLDPEVADRGPDLQRAKWASLFGSIFAKPWRTLHASQVSVCTQVRRNQRECVTHGHRIFNEHHPRVHWYVHPFVRIQRDAVGSRQ